MPGSARRPHVIVVQHEDGEGPGALARALGAAGLDSRLVRTWLGEQVPEAPGAARGVVVLGGGMSAAVPLAAPHLVREVALLRAAGAAKLPALGLCLGAQLLSVSLGGAVARAPRPELGFLRVRLAPAAQDDALLAGLPASFVAFHWHRDAFTLPTGAVALASSTATPLQAFRAGVAWGLQFHPEATGTGLAAMIASGEQELREAGVDPTQLLAAAERELPRMDAWRLPLFARWAALAAGERR